MEHLLNCHGEWILFLQVVGGVPVFGGVLVAMARSWFPRNHDTPKAD